MSKEPWIISGLFLGLSISFVNINVNAKQAEDKNSNKETPGKTTAGCSVTPLSWSRSCEKLPNKRPASLKKAQDADHLNEGSSSADEAPHSMLNPLLFNRISH